MGEVTKKVLVLCFGTDAGKQMSLTIKKPGDTLEGTDIKAAMERIVQTGAFGEEAVATTSLSAKYVKQEVEEVTLG